MKLALHKSTDGTHFVICVCGPRTRKQIVIPLSAELSAAIERMVKAEGIRTEKLILPPLFNGAGPPR